MLRIRSRVRLNNRQAIQMVQRKAAQFVSAVGQEGMALSRVKAPFAYSTLVDSAYSQLVQMGPIIAGTFGYTASYAAPLEFGTWSPRPPPKYNKQGTPANAWNPQATPGFLVYGFESQAALAYQARLEMIFRI